MSAVKEQRDKIIAAINELPEEGLQQVDELLQKINLQHKKPVQEIYEEVKKKYDKTLHKLAE